jgi:hypothetical protein
MDLPILSSIFATALLVGEQSRTRGRVKLYRRSVRFLEE